MRWSDTEKKRWCSSFTFRDISASEPLQNRWNTAENSAWTVTVRVVVIVGSLFLVADDRLCVVTLRTFP